MKLTPLKIKHLRCDIDKEAFINNVFYLQNNIIQDVQIGKQEGTHKYWIGSRLRISFYLKDIANEVIGYLGERRAIIEEVSSPEIDKGDIIGFIQTFNINAEIHIIENLPNGLGTTPYKYPDLNLIAEEYIRLFYEFGLYR